ncbi:Aste57867_21377 [Aphanomyces stellatus]|uniref:Aste57867_21377 protein n=1 Tax=Aphanomyces stellatus TaxID=120398 RepID=A0A485LHE9_9STRA|nr:hypothetical protein As57867_021308 [Aphanomyces stellatus]VFT98049.1 Aste57867_21377 [Aphanomyces stellatus]
MSSQINKDLTIAARSSYVSSVESDENDNNATSYDQIKSPVDHPLEDGALREGGAPIYTSPDVLALIAQYACIGLLMGGIGGMKYPILINYFALEANTLMAANGLMGLGWSLKVFFGMLSDCFPIFGFCRKPYIFIGWVLTSICLVVIAVKPAGGPNDPSAPLVDQEAAQSRGSTLALLCTILCFCYIMADVSCDALVVAYAQREPIQVRGRLQTIVIGTRTLFTTLTTAISGFLLNSVRMGGSFDFDIGVNWYFAILAIPCVANIPVVWYFLQDTKKDKVQLGVYFRRFFDLIQKRVVWQVMIFNYMFGFFSAGITTTASAYIPVFWAKVESLNSALSGIVGSLIFAVVLGVVGKWGTNWNWRIVMALTVLCTSSIDAIVQYLTIYDVVRSQWFYLGVPLAENIPSGIQFVVGMFVIVELAEVGNEGLVYGLLTTISNLPGTFGIMITNVYCAHFKVGRLDIKADTPDVRSDVATTYAISYGTTIIACLWVFLLPPQKEAVAHLKKHGGDYPITGALVIGTIWVIFCLSFTSTMLSMFESTQCLLLAGGRGC